MGTFSVPAADLAASARPAKVGQEQPLVLQPMPLWLSLACFGVPTILGWVCIYGGIPILLKAGVPLFWSFWLCMSFPMVVMFAAALAAYRWEGNPWTWAGIQRRFRLNPMRKNDWLWTLVLVAWIGGYMILRQTLSKWLASLPLFAPPDFLPEVLDPRVQLNGLPEDMMGVLLKGNWWILLVLLAVLFFNIFGEEFWWRGYILPRQELKYGKDAWWFHGLLWTLVHTFWKWDFLSILPGALLLTYVVWRQKNTTPAILWHWLNNGLTLIAILLGILGLT